MSYKKSLKVYHNLYNGVFRKIFIVFAKSIDFTFVLGYNNTKSRFSKSRLDSIRGVLCLLGRETELKFLNDKYNSDGGQLVVLYGRRRVGKTETLREFCKEKPHVFFSCTQTTDRVQLQKFSKQILKENNSCKNYIIRIFRLGKSFRRCSRFAVWG